MEMGAMPQLSVAARTPSGGISSSTTRRLASLLNSGAAVWDSQRELAAYRIVQEAVKSAAEHGHAGHCIVSLFVDGDFHLTVRDDGAGQPEMFIPGVGLLSMRERAEELGGRLHTRQAHRSKYNGL